MYILTFCACDMEGHIRREYSNIQCRLCNHRVKMNTTQIWKDNQTKCNGQSEYIHNRQLYTYRLDQSMKYARPARSQMPNERNHQRNNQYKKQIAAVEN